ncbi:MAG: T9SS type A sorting domain-containing protein [Saprospiraceae bacterium]|nr:T9SS type A sorting domain-containing protein [Saprospiraceae bacterium]
MIKSNCFLTLGFLFLNLIYAFSQQTIRSSILHDGLTRTFSFYVPANYTLKKPVALVFNLHGYGSNNDQQEFYGDFRKISDTAGFIVVHPNGTLFPQSNQSFWNVGLVGNSNVDDVGFIHALIDTLSKAYSIDPERIYSTGMSNGGFMSYHLACVSNRFAAIASVTGSMTLQTVSACKNASPLPILEIHGDADLVVDYNGSTGVFSIPSVLAYWIAKNGLNTQNLIKSNVPDINKTDGASAELYIYPGLNEVQHYKILNGGHTWPGALIAIGTTCMDFSASTVIWNFFNKYRKQTVNTQDLNIADFQISPNPVTNTIKITQTEFNEGAKSIQCINQLGIALRTITIQSSETLVDLSDLPSGIYFLVSQSQKKSNQIKFIKL